jgi:SAM-dependent methyltransferase
LHLFAPQFQCLGDENAPAKIFERPVIRLSNMNGEAYYNYQAVARGLYDVADVERLAAAQSQTYRRLLLRWLPASRDAAIYEAGCGPGIFLRFLRSEGYVNLAGSDSSEPALALARAAGFSVTLADAIEDMRRYPRASLDCVIAIDFIEHLPKDVLIQFLELSAGILKPGGALLLRGPNGDSPFVSRNLFYDITHYWAYTTLATKALLNMAGFERVAFADETLASIRRYRILTVPAAWLSQIVVRWLIRIATREVVRYWGSSIVVAAWR